MQSDTGLDEHQIENLKREAKKLRKLLNVTHSAALDILATRHGYKNWSLLDRASNRMAHEAASTTAAQTVHGPTEATLQRACLAFIKTLDDERIERLCRSWASLWVPAYRVQDGTFAGIRVLGIAGDTISRRYAEEEGLILLADFSGLGDHLVFDGDEDYEEDEDGNPIPPAYGELFTPSGGRELLAGLPFIDDIDAVMERLERFLHPWPEY